MKNNLMNVSFQDINKKQKRKILTKLVDCRDNFPSLFDSNRITRSAYLLSSLTIFKNTSYYPDLQLDSKHAVIQN